MPDRRPSNRLRREIEEGMKEYDRRSAIARCGTRAPWDPEFLKTIRDRHKGEVSLVEIEPSFFR